MPFLLAREALTLAEAAQYLGITEKKVELAIIGGDLPCGVIARGWRGIARPEIPGVHFEYRITNIDPREYSATAYDGHGNKLYEETIPEVATGHFWYLDGGDAYELLATLEFRAGRRVGWLHPHEGEELHADNPRWWPAPPFIVWLNSEQEHDTLITREDLLLLRADLDHLKAKFFDNDRAPNTAPPRNHDDLTIGAPPRVVEPMKRADLIRLMRKTYPETASWFSRVGAGTLQEAAKLPQHGMWDAAAALAWAEARTARRAVLDDWPAPDMD